MLSKLSKELAAQKLTSKKDPFSDLSVPLKVGIQGVRACFHDVVAREYFKQRPIEAIECKTFKDLCSSLQDHQSDVCLMAIENSIAGSILTNYALLEAHQFKIIGEIYLRIELHLMALSGQQISDLQFIQSHPMALLQCSDFLSQHSHLQALEYADTAESAKHIQEKKLKGYGAIASFLASECYELEILAEGIESNKQNYTRFLVICRQEDAVENSSANKASIRFEVPDCPGSLAKVLVLLESHFLNMTKIQSIPILGQVGQYSFHVDLEWQDRNDYQKACEELKNLVTRLVLFGEYCKSHRP